MQTQSKQAQKQVCRQDINIPAFFFDVEKWLDMGKDNTDQTSLMLLQCWEAGTDKNGCLPTHCSV